MGAIDIRKNNNLSRLNSKVYLKMKRLKTAKGQSEAVTQRTENTMIRRKRAIRSRNSKDREHNDQKKKNRGTNNDLHTITQKTKDRITRTPLNSPCSIMYLNMMVVAIYIIYRLMYMASFDGVN